MTDLDIQEKAEEALALKDKLEEEGKASTPEWYEAVESLDGWLDMLDDHNREEEE